MRLTISPLTPDNRARVLQLFQKTNQFNLTSRRHGDADLDRLERAGARIGVFAYEDIFGPQGIISVVVVIPDEAGDGTARIDSWLMSCRVLSRTVEEAVFEWILEQTRGCRRLVGEYVPTERNALVRPLYTRLGLSLESHDPATGTERLAIDLPVDESARPAHFLHIVNAVMAS